MPRLVCLSDTHNCNEQISVPDGDILIHSGDATITGTRHEIKLFSDWFAALPHRHKIFVAGNHDWLFEQDRDEAQRILDLGIVYLQDSSAEVEGLKLYGSPWQPRFYDWAFNLNRGAEIAEKWRSIPDAIDVLITHGPPNGILDEVATKWGIENAGCEELRRRVEEITAFGYLKLHIFGHIHGGYGLHEAYGMRFVNASSCDEQYHPTQQPIIVDI